MSIIRCDYCGKPFKRYPSQMYRRNFCSRSCLAAFASREKNPSGYRNLKDYSSMSENMRDINRALNPIRMTPPVRMKLRQAKLGTGVGASYEKTFGRHTHRVVAERMLGRKLKPGEVVHHIDGNKRNNVPENLMVFRSQREHAAFHARQEVMPK